MTSALIERLRQYLPMVGDGPDDKIWCVVLGSDLRAAVEQLVREVPAITFEELWKTLPIPGEYDSMDECDQGRWRGVVHLAFSAGASSTIPTPINSKP